MSGVRLLIVDDDAMQIELVERALSGDGFDVRSASSLAEVAEIAASFLPELVLVDVNMPDVPNERAVAVVRDGAPAAQLILYSAWEESKLKKLALAAGADGYVSKSASVFELSARLRAFQR